MRKRKGISDVLGRMPVDEETFAAQSSMWLYGRRAVRNRALLRRIGPLLLAAASRKALPTLAE